MTSSRISVEYIVPVYNEESCIGEFIKRILPIRDRFQDLEISCLFINDGSHDRSLELLKDYAARYDFVKLVNLSRNFGHQIAVTAGLDYCESDYAVIIDADLQDPPELIGELYQKARSEDADIVYAVRRTRDKEAAFKLVTAKLFYKFINLLCRTEIPADTGDFRLVSRKAIQSISTLRERHRFLRGMFPWIGFKSSSVLYDRDGRFAGESKYSFRKMFRFAADAVMSFSNAPLRFATYLGLGITALGVLSLVGASIVALFTNSVISGSAWILAALSCIGGLQILILGIIGEYIGRIFEEIKGRPLYLVDGVINIGDENRLIPVRAASR